MSVISVQAQTDTAGNMDNMTVLMTGNIAETITCNMTRNAVVIGNMDKMAGKMSNMTGKMDNMTNPMTFNVTGKIAIIKDMGNMT